MSDKITQIKNGTLVKIDVLIESSQNMPLSAKIEEHNKMDAMLNDIIEKKQKESAQLNEMAKAIHETNAFKKNVSNPLTETIINDIDYAYPGFKRQLLENEQRKERERKERERQQVIKAIEKIAPKSLTMFNSGQTQAEKRSIQKFNETMLLLKTADLDVLKPDDVVKALKESDVSDMQLRTFSQQTRDFILNLREFVSTLENANRSESQRINLRKNVEKR